MLHWNCLKIEEIAIYQKCGVFLFENMVNWNGSLVSILYQLIKMKCF